MGLNNGNLYIGDTLFKRNCHYIWPDSEGKELHQIEEKKKMSLTELKELRTLNESGDQRAVDRL